MRDRTGAYADDPVEVGAILLEDREGLWVSRPPDLPGGEVLLDNYFVQRQPAFPNAPEPRWAPLATLVLAAGGSAGGYDQELYEAYH